MKKTVCVLAAAMLLGLTACAGGGAGTTTAPSKSAETSAAVSQTTAAASEPETSAPQTSSSGTTPAETTEARTGCDVNIAVLAGPTGIGASVLMEKNEQGECRNSYQFSVASANDAVVAGLASGSLDMAAVATNVASSLWNKTSGGVQICALNTKGVLYILEKGEAVQSVQDLKGRTIYAVGQGANPEYVLEYILGQNGLSWSTDGGKADVAIEFMDSESLVAGMVKGTYDLCMLPVPAVTAVKLQNKEVRTALSLTDEWNKTAAGGELVMGCIVVRKAFAEAHPEAVEAFLADYEESITAVQADPAAAGTLCEKFGIVPKAAIATKAIPDASLCFVAGAEIQPALEPYYRVLFEANPKSIGGAIPGEGFYYPAK